MSRIAVLSVVMIAGALGWPRAASSQPSSMGGIPSPSLLGPSPSQALLLGSAWPDEPRIESSPDRLLELPQVRNRRGIPLMIAGGAMFLVGAIIGDDVGALLLLGGVGVGAYGAYVYFDG
jgi:hypothetical protein